MRYKKLPGRKGIYEDTNSGKLWCQKRIKGKLYSETFDNLKEASHWVKNFSPENHLFSKMKIDDPTDFNGKKSALVSEVWELYKKHHISTLEITSQEVRMGCESFLAPIMNNDIRSVTSQLVGQLVTKNRNDYIESGKTKRSRFDNELKTMRSMLTWWRENYDMSFYCPVMKKHFEQGVIKKTIKRNSLKMSEEILVKFIDEMYRIGAEDNLFAMLAETQYLTTARVQEPVGITADKVNFSTGFLILDQAMGYTRKKEHDNYLKGTKTNSFKNIKLKGRLKEIMLTLKNRGLKEISFPVSDGIRLVNKKVKFLFHIDGHPPTYRMIQYRYNQALQNLGLYPQFTSTHIMRHASSNHIRKGLGLDHAQVAGDWRSAAIAETYSGTQDEYRDESIEYLETRLKAIK